MILIGREDKIDIPELSLFEVEAKIDTGAYGCALHCHHIELIKIEDKDVLTFKVLDPNHDEYKDKIFHIDNFKCKRVKNSGGKQEKRYTFKTRVILFKKKITTEFSLTDRGQMKFPILLGRQFINKRYLVDVQLKNLSYNNEIMKL